MRQALHILKKDIRYLWIEITSVLVAAGMFVFTAASPQSAWQSPLPRTVASFLMQYLLPFAWWTLITRAVHAETLIGDRQFWPTRPYDWRSLLLAKGLLFVLFVNLPLLVGQAIVIQMHGFSVMSEIPGLLWSQLLFTVVLILPIAAVAAVTSSVVQFLVIGLVAFVLVILLSLRFMLFASAMMGGGWGPLEWISGYYGILVVLVTAPAILIWQYRQRRTWPVRALALVALVALVLGVPIPWTTAFALQSRLSRQPAAGADIRAGAFPEFSWMTRALIGRDGAVAIHVPIQLLGVPDSLRPVPEGIGANFIAPSGAVWHAAAGSGAHVSTTGRLITLQTTLDGASYRQIKDQPIRISGSMYLTLYGNRREFKLPFTEQTSMVPGLGKCAASTGKNAPYFLVCDSVFRPQPEMVSVQFEDANREVSPYAEPRMLSYSPFPAQFGLDPVNSYTSYSIYKGKLDTVTITTLEPVAHIRVPLLIENLKLADYEKRL
jgi:hypothetical protein